MEKTEDYDYDYIASIAEKALPSLLEAYHLGLAEDISRSNERWDSNDNRYPLSDDAGDYEGLAKAAFAVGWAMWHAREELRE